MRSSSTTEWQENAGEEGRVAWADCGDFVLEARRKDDEEELPARWSVLDTMCEAEFEGDDVDGDPTLDELKRLAVEGAAKWLDGLKAKLPRGAR